MHACSVWRLREVPSSGSVSSFGLSLTVNTKRVLPCLVGRGLLIRETLVFQFRQERAATVDRGNLAPLCG